MYTLALQHRASGRQLKPLLKCRQNVANNICSLRGKPYGRGLRWRKCNFLPFQTQVYKGNVVDCVNHRKRLSQLSHLKAENLRWGSPAYTLLAFILDIDHTVHWLNISHSLWEIFNQCTVCDLRLSESLNCVQLIDAELQCSKFKMNINYAFIVPAVPVT